MPSSLFSQNLGAASPLTNPLKSPQQNNGGFQPPANLAQIKGLMNLMRNGSNPQQLIQNAISNNPQYGQVLSLVNQHGGDARAAFYALAKEKGVDPNQILNLLK